MKPSSRFILVLFITACTLPGCATYVTRIEGKELAASCFLERAIEVGEKAVEEQGLIQHVAMTEGTYAALKLNDELRHHDHYEQFWELLKQADSVWKTIPDTTDQIAVRAHLTPYVEHIMDIAEEILP